VLVTCEHGGHEVPEVYRSLFAGRDDVLMSHRGWDAGSLALAGSLSRALDAPLRVATTTRLLVDLNRSSHNRAVFSEVTRTLSAGERRRLLAEYHAPHREAVARDVAEGVRAGGCVLHLAVHTFTPSFNGSVRRTDVGLLYDPARASERVLVGAWTEALKRRLPRASVRRNHPYRGVTDGLTTWLRRTYGDRQYLGIEIEVSQRLLDGRGRVPARVASALAEGLAESLGSLA
jgi:predicted N-formylglutamate amidohydrolase